jgi:predicted nucleic acid-binding protein
MPSALQDLYWDSCVFISWLDNIPDRVKHIAPILSVADPAGKKRQYRILTSTLSIAEVAFSSLSSQKKAMNQIQQQKIDNLLDVATKISAHELIMIKARDLMRDALKNGWPIPSGADAIHLASALQVGVSEMNTYDRKLIGLDGKFGITICHPFALQPVLPGIVTPP